MVRYTPQIPLKQARKPSLTPPLIAPSGLGDKGIVANWLFYYLKGDDHLHDFSKENHATISGAKWVSTKKGWGLEFDGVDDYVKTPVNINGSAQSGVTIMAWIYPTEVSKNMIYASKEDTNELNLRIAWDGAFTWTTYDGTEYGLDAGSATANTWQKVTARYEEGVGYDLFKNGSLVGSSSETTWVTDTANEWIGMRNDKVWAFAGIITLVRVYNVAKSDSFITRRFERERGIFGV